MLLPCILITFLFSFSLLYYSKPNENTINDKSRDKSYIYFVFFVFYLLLAFRGVDVGNDTPAYAELYARISKAEFHDLDFYFDRFEKGYIYLNKFLSFISYEPQTLFIVSGLFILACSGRFIYKYSKVVWFSLILFFLLRYFDDYMNVLRQSIALSFVLLSYDYVRKKKYLQFIVLVLIASLFHKSAIVFLLAAIAVNVKFSKKIFYIFLMSTICIYFIGTLLIKLLFQYEILFDYYLDSEYLEAGKIAPLINLVISFMIVSLGLLTKSHLKFPIKQEQNNNFIVVNDNNNMLMFLLIGILLSTLNLHFALIGRVAIYFNFFSIIYLPNSIRTIKNKRTRIMLAFITLLVFVCYYLIIITLRPDWNLVYPYSFFWEVC